MTAPKKAPAKTPARRPATAKKPQDRKPKATEVEGATREELPDDGGYRVTYKGVSLDLTPDLLNDYEFIKAMKSNDIPDVLPKFAGSEEIEAKIVEACRDEKGIVRVYGPGSVDEFIGTMLEALAPN